MITIQNYTQEELQYIQDNYSNMTVKDIAAVLKKRPSSVYNAINKLGLRKQKHTKWSDADIEFLKLHYADMTSLEMSRYIPHTIAAINTMRDHLQLSCCKKWTKEEISYLKNNFENTLFSEIAKTLDRTEGAIRAKCFDLKLFKKTPWTEEDSLFLKENYMEMKTSDISKILNRTSDAVEIKARKMGLKKSPYTCNYRFFEEINTEEKAYWLGFLGADGWISRNEESNSCVTGMDLQYKDLEHLKKFNKSINGNYKITDRWRTCSLSKDPDKKNHLCTIRVYSTIMYNSLTNLGFTNDKSYSSHIPNIPSNLLRHYIRGYFDGDGCFTFTNKSFHVDFITASQQLNNDLVKILDSLNLHYSDTNYISEFGTKTYRIYINRIEDKICFLNWIYEDSNIYLDRKYKKYQKVKNHYITTDSLSA